MSKLYDYWEQGMCDGCGEKNPACYCDFIEEYVMDEPKDHYSGPEPYSGKTGLKQWLYKNEDYWLPVLLTSIPMFLLYLMLKLVLSHTH